ncbi:MAG: hypothetical protein QXI19_06985 [Candidatus Caldarchaeum sp.]
MVEEQSRQDEYLVAVWEKEEEEGLFVGVLLFHNGKAMEFVRSGDVMAGIALYKRGISSPDELDAELQAKGYYRIL